MRRLMRNVWREHGRISRGRPIDGSNDDLDLVQSLGSAQATLSQISLAPCNRRPSPGRNPGSSREVAAADHGTVKSLDDTLAVTGSRLP